jgi:ADP-ribose pyrophosphatase
MSLEIIGKRKKYQGEFMELWATNFIKNTGKAGEWEWIAKKDGVVVLPITKDNKIVLIENFRIPVGGYNVELPAGLLDKEGEPPPRLPAPAPD